MERAGDFEEGGRGEALGRELEGGQQEATAAKRAGTPPEAHDLNDRASDQQIDSMEEQLNDILAGKGADGAEAANPARAESVTGIEQPSQEILVQNGGDRSSGLQVRQNDRSSQGNLESELSRRSSRKSSTAQRTQERPSGARLQSQSSAHSQRAREEVEESDPPDPETQVIDSEDIVRDMTFDQLLNFLEYKKEEKKKIRLQLERGLPSDREKTEYIFGYLNKLQALERELVERVLSITNTVIRDFSMEALYNAPTHLKIKEVHYQLLEYKDRIQDLPEEMRGRLKSRVESYNLTENPAYKDYEKLYEIFLRVARQDQNIHGASGHGSFHELGDYAPDPRENYTLYPAARNITPHEDGSEVDEGSLEPTPSNVHTNGAAARQDGSIRAERGRRSSSTGRLAYQTQQQALSLQLNSKLRKVS